MSIETFELSDSARTAEEQRWQKLNKKITTSVKQHRTEIETILAQPLDIDIFVRHIENALHGTEQDSHCKIIRKALTSMRTQKYIEIDQVITALETSVRQISAQDQTENPPMQWIYQMIDVAYVGARAEQVQLGLRTKTFDAIAKRMTSNGKEMDVIDDSFKRIVKETYRTKTQCETVCW